MDNLTYKIEVFEGPMDLLLHLISKHKLNIKINFFITLLCPITTNLSTHILSNFMNLCKLIKIMLFH